MLVLAFLGAWELGVRSGWVADQVRRAVVGHLVEAFGRPVALGGVSGDLAGGLDLTDLVIAQRGGFRHGVLFSADRVHVAFDLPGLLRHPGQLVQYVTRIDLWGPRLVLARDSRGVWDVQDLVEARRRVLAPGFRGQVTVRGGVLSYSDARDLPTPFRTEFQEVAGTLQAEGGQAVRLRLSGRTPEGEQASVQGQYLAASGVFDAEVTARGGSVRRWGGYLVRLPGLRWAGGRFDGRVHVMATAARVGLVVDYSGRVDLHDAAAAYLPRRVVLQHGSGDVTVDTTHAATQGLSVVADGAPLWVRGRIDYPGGPWLEVIVRSREFDLGRIRALFFPRSPVHMAGRAQAEVWITGPADSPLVDGTIAAASGRVNRQDFAGLRGEVRYAGDILALEGLSSRVAGGQVSGDVVVDLAGPSPTYAFTGQGTGIDLGLLPGAWPDLPRGLDGRVSGRVVGSGTGPHLRVMGEATMGPGTLAGQPIDSLRAFLWDDGGDLALDYLRATRGPLTLYASGRVSATGGLHLRVQAFGAPPDPLRLQTPEGPWTVTAETALTGTLGGSVRAPAFSGQVTAWDGQVGPFPFDLLRADVTSLGPEGVTVRSLDLLQGTGRYHASGTVGFHPLRAAALQVDAADVDAAAVARAIPGAIPVSGDVSAHLTVAGPLSRPTVAGQLELTTGQVAGQRVDHATIDLVSRGRVVQVKRLAARRNGSRLLASGTVDPQGPVDLHFTADRLRLSDVDVAAGVGVVPQGTVDARGTVRGTLGAPEVDVEVSSSDLALRGQTFQATGSLRYRPGVVTFSPLELDQGTARYRLDGELRAGPVPSADLQLDVQRGRVSTIVAASGVDLPVPLSGQVDGHVALSGPLRDPTARVAVELRDGRVDGVPVATGRADATLAHGAVDIHTLQLNPDHGQVTAQGRVVLGGTSFVEVSARDLDADVLRPLLRIPQPLLGSVNFTMQWSGPTRAPVAGLSLEARDVGVPGATVDRVLGLAHYKDGVLRIESGLLEKGTHKAVVQGTLPIAPDRLALDPQRSLALSVRLQDADLSLLSLLTPEIHDASGTVQGQVTVGGTVAEPEMNGFVRTRGGTVQVSPLRTPIKDLAADVTFSQDEIVLKTLTAALGGGELDAHGTVSVKSLRPDQMDLSLVGRHLMVDVPGLYQGGVDAALHVAGAAAHPVLSGRVILSQGQVGGELAQSRPGRLGPPVALDVTLQSGDNVRLVQGAVRTTLVGDVHVGGTAEAPKLSGRVRAVDGTITLLGTPFTLAEGEAAFSEALGFDPQITARAQAVIGDTRVFMTVSGVAPNLSVQWSSDPPLPQQEILALVSGSGTGGPAGALVSQELGRLLLGSVGQAIQRALRLDEFSISYDTQSPITLRIGKFIVHNLYLSLAEVLVRPTVTTPVPLPAPLPRPAAHTQSYLALGVQYFLSPSVYLAYDVDSLGGSGVFLLTRFPF